jgi:hypothetical protein
MVLVFKDDPEIYIVVLVNEGLTQKLRIWVESDYFYPFYQGKGYSLISVTVN